MVGSIKPQTTSKIAPPHLSTLPNGAQSTCGSLLEDRVGEVVLATGEGQGLHSQLFTSSYLPSLVHCGGDE